jgi:hypothetical protein
MRPSTTSHGRRIRLAVLAAVAGSACAASQRGYDDYHARMQRQPPPPGADASTQRSNGGASIDSYPNRFPLTFEQSASAESQKVRGYLPPAFASVGALAGILVRMPRDVPITVRSCGQSNAYYLHRTHSIIVCDEFLAEVYAAHGGDLRAFRATVVFAVYHEIGHAFVDVFSVPYTEGNVFGKEEDAVDAFSFLFFTEAGLELGTDATATYFDALARAETGKTSDGTHSSSRDRATTAHCLFNGSRRRLPRDTPAICVELHRESVRMWNQWLAAYSNVEARETFHVVR